MNDDVAGTLPSPDFAARRASACARMGRGVLVLSAAPIQYASRDTEQPYVADRELYYLTGLTEPDTVAVLCGDDGKLVVFARDRSPEAELWAGPRLGAEAAGERAGADEAHSIAELHDRLPGLLNPADRIHFRLGRGGVLERSVIGALEHARARGPRQGTGPRSIVEPGEVLDELRLVKDQAELAALRAACAVTVEGHLRGAAVIGPGTGEWAVEAELEAAFRRSGATRPGFGTIVGGGMNACTLHYVENRDRLPPDGLVLIDAGAEVGFYHGDVTRTYPISGRFTAPQRAVYDVVDRARQVGIEAARPGAAVGDVHGAAVREITAGLVELGVLDGDIDGLIEQGAYKPFYPHQTSHWLGLDVHDPGDYARDGVSRELRPGMVFTVEPGLYLRPTPDVAIPDELVGIGVRIEDDVAVSGDGCEVLTAALPTEADEVEALVGASG